MVGVVAGVDPVDLRLVGQPRVRVTVVAVRARGGRVVLVVVGVRRRVVRRVQLVRRRAGQAQPRIGRGDTARVARVEEVLTEQVVDSPVTLVVRVRRNRGREAVRLRPERAPGRVLLRFAGFAG